MSTSYHQQFGNKDVFALVVSLHPDLHPTQDRVLDEAWGSLEIWADGRCLTASIADGQAIHHVEWSLLPILKWLVEVGVRLVNEEPLPLHSRLESVRDGSHWYDATIQSPWPSSPDDEDAWYLRRSAWRQHHALRRAANDVALPNVVIRRLGDALEISWDNENWAPPRRNLTFLERRGCVFVDARAASETLERLVQSLIVELSTRVPPPLQPTWFHEANRFKTRRDDWKWLIPEVTEATIREALPEFAKQLDQSTDELRHGLFVPHTNETRILRSVRSERVAEIQALLQTLSALPPDPMSEALQRLLHPTHARHDQPWDEGNDYAQTVREAMGWAADPIPDLEDWLPSQGVRLPMPVDGLPTSVAVLSTRTNDLRALAHVNRHAASWMRLETGLATALGHLLMDVEPVAIDGEWEHWPTAARARAFGVALTLPEEGIRQLLGSTQVIGTEEVQALMLRFRSGRSATIQRLRNLRMISDEQRVELYAHLPAS